MTEWEDCKHDDFFTLNLTENDNCKCYDEYEYDQKWLETVMLVVWYVFIHSAWLVIEDRWRVYLSLS